MLQSHYAFKSHLSMLKNTVHCSVKERYKNAQGCPSIHTNTTC